MNGKLDELLARTLPPMGYELVDWEMSRGRMLRVFIDKPVSANAVARGGVGAAGSPSTIAPGSATT